MVEFNHLTLEGGKVAIFGRIEDLKLLFTKTQELEYLLINIESIFSGERLKEIQALQCGENHRIDLNYGMFYNASCYALKSEQDGFFESHQKYIDFQIVVEGFEGYLIGSKDKFNLTQVYNKDKDLEVYTPKSALNYLRMNPKEMVILFPEDIHGVGIGYKEDIGKLVKKVIFKVPIKYIKHRL